MLLPPSMLSTSGDREFMDLTTEAASKVTVSQECYLTQGLRCALPCKRTKRNFKSKEQGDLGGETAELRPQLTVRFSLVQIQISYLRGLREAG